MSSKLSINLLQAELFPEKALLTLPRIVGLWLALLMVMFIWVIYTQYNLKQSTTKHSNLLLEKQQKQKQTQQLASQLKNRQAAAVLVQKLHTIKLVMQHKDALLDKLTDANKTFAGGFVMAMNDLSTMHHKDIRLQSININTKGMSFMGLALTPEAVPAWLAGFKTSRLLSGKVFEQFKLTQNEEKITEFVVSSIAKKDKS